MTADCHVLTPTRNQDPCSCLLTQPWWNRGVNQKSKREKMLGWGKDTLVGKAWVAWIKKKKEFIHHFWWLDRCSTISRKAGLRHTWWCLGKTWEALIPDTFPFLLPSLTLCSEHEAMLSGISLCSVQVSCLSCVPSKFLTHACTPSLPSGRKVWECVDCAQLGFW